MRDHGPPKKASSIAEYRKLREEQGIRNQAFLEDPAFTLLADVNVQDSTVNIPEVPDHKFPIRIYRPKDTEHSHPVMLFFHGGYWCAGDANSEDLGNRAVIARGTDIIIVSFECRRIPEVKWDAHLQDAEYAMKWLAENASRLGADTRRGFLVGGAEAGAHLAAVCAIRARNQYPDIRITGQVLIVPFLAPWTEDANIPEEWAGYLTSQQENAEAPVLDIKHLKMFIDALGVPASEKQKGENFPLCASSLRGLPPTYIPVDECDPIRDQGFLYAERLQEAGVLTRTDYYRGLPNMFVQFPELPMTLKAGGQLSAAVAWLLQERK